MIRNDGPRRSWLVHCAWVAALGATLVGLTRCRPASDRIAGIELGVPRTLSLRVRCAHDCQADYVAALRAEASRFRAALRACGARADCLSERRRVHRQLLNELLRDRLKCKRACYNEGAGSAGS